MIQKPTPKRDTLSEGFISTMLKSAEENKEVKPQTRVGDVNPGEIEGILSEIKKGKFRK